MVVVAVVTAMLAVLPGAVAEVPQPAGSFHGSWT